MQSKARIRKQEFQFLEREPGEGGETEREREDRRNSKSNFAVTYLISEKLTL
jgi:hypothetical protein